MCEMLAFSAEACAAVPNLANDNNKKRWKREKTETLFGESDAAANIENSSAPSYGLATKEGDLRSDQECNESVSSVVNGMECSYQCEMYVIGVIYLTNQAQKLQALVKVKEKTFNSHSLIALQVSRVLKIINTLMTVSSITLS